MSEQRTPRRVVWRGNDDESATLLLVVARYCACTFDAGAQTGVCAVHRMLAGDQRAMDGLLFMRRQADCLRRQEFTR